MHRYIDLSVYSQAKFAIRNISYQDFFLRIPKENINIHCTEEKKWSKGEPQSLKFVMSSLNR